MIKAAKMYVKIIDKISTFIGSVIRFLVLATIGLLVFEALSRNLFNAPHKWVLEMTQFINGTYYLIGGAFTLLVGGHARMDFLYEDWSPRKKAFFDILTVVFEITFLVVLINGGYKSAAYALKYKQITYSAWGPPIAPIKIISIVGMCFMLLQSISELIKDLSIAIGKDDQWFTRRQEEIT